MAVKLARLLGFCRLFQKYWATRRDMMKGRRKRQVEIAQSSGPNKAAIRLRPSARQLLCDWPELKMLKCGILSIVFARSYRVLCVRWNRLNPTPKSFSGSCLYLFIAQLMSRLVSRGLCGRHIIPAGLTVCRGMGGIWLNKSTTRTSMVSFKKVIAIH